MGREGEKKKTLERGHLDTWKEEEEKLENKHGRGKEEVEIGREDVTPPPHYSNSHPLTQRTPPGHHAMQRPLPSKQEGGEKSFFKKNLSGKRDSSPSINLSTPYVARAWRGIIRPRDPRRKKKPLLIPATSVPPLTCVSPLCRIRFTPKKTETDFPRAFFRER